MYSKSEKMGNKLKTNRQIDRQTGEWMDRSMMDGCITALQSLTWLFQTDWIHKPVGLHTQRAQWDASCQPAGCEVYTPSRTAESLTSQGNRRSLADCNLRGNLKHANNNTTMT